MRIESFGMTTVFEDGQECKHKGCRFHVLHPCEGCGRTGARGKVKLPTYMLEGWQRQRLAGKEGY